MSNMAKNLILWVVIALVLMSVFNNFGPRRSTTEQIEYSRFIADVKQGRVQKVVIEGRNIQGVLQTGERFNTYTPETDNKALVGDLLENGVVIDARPPEQQSLLMQIFISWFPMLLLIGVWIFFMRQMQGGAGGRGALSFGKSRARLLGEDQVKVTFADVAGVDEAKEEVAELVDFLRDPAKFQKLGGKIPSGVLMVGSAGHRPRRCWRVQSQARRRFRSSRSPARTSVEMFVGVGASRVRDMFEQAKKHAPCIIFIDEIDAVGRHRGAGLGGGHDEREQTLNQLLVEMDGFEGNEGIIVIAATNRPDVLDPALLRPGRFDRQVVVPLPDIRGREQILKIHMRKIPLDRDVEPNVIARGTPGFSGADLANLVNEAALFAARANPAHRSDMEQFEKAKDKIMMGSERRSLVMSEDEKRLTAYHEAGHAIVGLLVPSHDPVYKGHDHSARARPGSDDVPPRGGPLQLQQGTAREPDLQPVRRAYCGSAGLRPRTRHHRREQRHPARHRARPEHGDAMGVVREAGPAYLQRRRGRGLPGSQRQAAQDGLGSDAGSHRRGSAQHHRAELPALDQDSRGERTAASRHGRRADPLRNDRCRADQGHHGRPRAETAAGLVGSLTARVAILRRWKTRTVASNPHPGRVPSAGPQACTDEPPGSVPPRVRSPPLPMVHSLDHPTQRYTPSG